MQQPRAGARGREAGSRAWRHHRAPTVQAALTYPRVRRDDPRIYTYQGTSAWKTNRAVHSPATPGTCILLHFLDI